MGESTPMRQWVLAGAGVVMIAAAGAMALRGRTTPVAAPPRTVSASPLLYVQRDGTTLRLHWNADAPEVRGAKIGKLSIADGKRESRMDLNGAELRAGVASYWPESREVTFRLELDGAAAGSIHSSAQVEERRPSPFDRSEKPRRRAVPVKRVQAEAARSAVLEEAPKRSSKIGRVVGKIPLLRRLRKDRD